MRIVIEIDGVEGTALRTISSDRDPIVSDEELGDGGGGPDLTGSGAPESDTGAENDAGPPPDSLLEAVAAAEAEGRGTATEDAGADEQPGDAGPGPSA